MSNPLPFIFVKKRDTFQKVMLAKVEYVEAWQECVKLHLTDGNEEVGHVSLKKFMDDAGVGTFVRIHRSAAVNIHYIEEHTTTHVKVAGKQHAISKGYRAEFNALALHA